MAQKNTEEKGKVTLCGTSGCCPTVDFTDPNEVVFRDDFGGKVRLMREEWEELKAKFFTKTGESC